MFLLSDMSKSKSKEIRTSINRNVYNTGIDLLFKIGYWTVSVNNCGCVAPLQDVYCEGSIFVI